MPIDVFTDVSVEVQTLVVPEGGELPSDEELAAMEAEEAAARRVAAGLPPEEEPAAVAEPEPLPEPAAEAEPAEEEPDWRADAEAALSDQGT